MLAIEDLLYRHLPKYSSLPHWPKVLVGKFYKAIPLSVRYGKDYDRYLDLVQRERAFDRETIEEFQLARLRSIVRSAYQNVPYYRERLTPELIDLKSTSDMRNLPFLTKQDVRRDFDQLVAEKFPESRMIRLSTSGSTGEPLKLCYERGVVRTREFVYINDLWGRIGYRHGDRLAVFRSALVHGRQQGRLWEYEPIKNRWVFSSYDLTPENLPAMLAQLRKIRPDFFYVYPSALTIVASYMAETGEPPIDSIRGVLCGSENIFPSQIKLFETVFRCPVLRWYGLGELVALAGSCEHSHDYHCYSTYSYVELIDEQGNAVTEPGKMGEIVGTAFDNYSMPLIRYRTGDYATFGGTQCPKCGRVGMMFTEVMGRVQERIVDKNGYYHPLGPLIFGIHDEFWGNISAIQFQQDHVGIVRVSVVPGALSADEAVRYAYAQLTPRFRGPFELEVVAVDYIHRKESGKQTYLIQNLPMNLADSHPVGL